LPGINRRSRIGILDVTDIQDDENRRSNIRWCPNCEEAGGQSKMGKRIYLPEKKGEPVILPKDADEWLQCPACGIIIAKHEARGEGELQIDSEFELIETPFDFGQAVIESVGSSRKVDRSKLQNQQHKRLRKKQLAELDPEIRKEMIEGGEITSYEIIK
jgi:hypothetical protein